MSLSWTPIVLSVLVTACLTLAAVHLLVWLEVRRGLGNLGLSLGAAVALAGVAIAEFAMMQAHTPAAYGAATRWLHLPVWGLLMVMVGFVFFHLRAGRAWLMWAACGLRTVSLIVNFVVEPNLNYREITDLREVQFLGDVVAIPVGSLSPWMLLGTFSMVLIVIFVVDATLDLWRRGERQRAWVFGGGILLFLVAPTLEVTLVALQLVNWPPIVSLFAVPLVLAMSYDMSRDVVRSAWLERRLEASEDGLQRSEQRLELAAEGARLAFWEWDRERDEIWTTERGRALFGFAPEERIDLSRLVDKVYSEDRPAMLEGLARSLEDGAGYAREYRIVMPEGHLRWVAIRGRVDRGGEGKGKARMLRGVAFDITATKQAEERFRRVVEAAPCGIILMDCDGSIAYVNPQVEACFDYSGAELSGSGIGVLLPDFILPTRSDHAGVSGGSIATPAASDCEQTGLRKGGGEIPVHIGLSALPGPDRDMLLLTLIDVSERKEAERVMAGQRNELAHLSRVTMLSELSGSLAHELNQPLAAILSNSQAAIRFLDREPPEVDEVREILCDIVDADRRAVGIIEGLHLLFKRGEMQRAPIDINGVVLDVLKLVRSDMVNAELRTLTLLKPQLPDCLGDRVQLQQVLINLLMNGCEAMTGRAGSCEIIVTTDLASDGVIRVCVTDQGPGIAPEDLDRVFEPFFTTKAAGLGLGLAVCRRIIEAHGGHLWASRNSGPGACFCFTLPAFSGDAS